MWHTIFPLSLNYSLFLQAVMEEVFLHVLFIGLLCKYLSIDGKWEDSCPVNGGVHVFCTKQDMLKMFQWYVGDKNPPQPFQREHITHTANESDFWFIKPG